MRQDTRLKDSDTFSTAIFGKLETETALANASLADNSYYTTFTLDCIFEFKDESGELLGPASERA
jgi:hypothetical protein